MRDYNIVVGFILTAAITLITFITPQVLDDPDKKRRYAIYSVGAILIIVSCIMNIAAVVVKDAYVEVPNVKYHTREQAIEVLIADGFQVDLTDFLYDDQPTPVEGVKYLVKDTIPSSGSILLKDGSITVLMQKDEEALATEKSSIDEPKSNIDYTTEGFYPDGISTFNSNEFTLSIDSKALYMIVPDHEFDSYLGSTPIEGVNVDLYNFDTNEIVLTKQTDSTGSVKFSNLADGTYFYSLKIDGYDVSIPEDPFRLLYDPTNSTDILSWRISLEKAEAEKSHEFLIKLVDSNGQPIKNTPINISVSESKDSASIYSTMGLNTNNEGYLTLWHAVNSTEYYDVITFILRKGCTIQLFNQQTYVQFEISDVRNEYTVVFQ